MHLLPVRSVSLALAALAALAPMLLASEAHAQARGNFALDQFNPAPSGDDFFQVQSYRAGTGKVDFSGMLLAEYGRAPLTLYTLKNGERDVKLGNLVSDQLYLHISASISFYERLQLSLDLPVALLNRGDSTAADGTVLAPPSGASIGDLRAGARLRLFGERKAAIGAALAGYVFIPTGDDTAFGSSGTVRGNPSLLLGGRLGPVLWGLNGGVMIQKATTFGRSQIGTDMTFGGGAALVVAEDKLQIGPEIYGSTLLDKSGDPGSLPAFDTKDTNLEAILGVKARVSPMVIGAGAGPGLAKGVGTPSFRALLSIAYVPIDDDRDRDGILDEYDACIDVPGVHTSYPATNGCPQPDRDGDGILDKDDACPDVKGIATSDPRTNGCPQTDRDGDGILDQDDACPDVPGVADADPKKNGCPIHDRDKDGILDEVDACPDLPGVPNDDAAKNGCPPDRDGDGIYDKDDACPDVKGVTSTDPAKNGCPPDTDGDGITDDKDACPLEPGRPNNDPTKNGCPTVFVRGGSIVILEQVQFKTGSDFILPASDELLTNVNKIFIGHPEITMVLIEGHTDSRGGKVYNQGLSEHRAASVRKWLVKHGVDDKRLQSKGFGLTVPIGDNETDEGRQMNRRVEFKILEGAKRPDRAVQTTGTLPSNPAPEKK